MCCTIAYRLLSRYDFMRLLFMRKFAHKDPGLSGEEWTAEELQDFFYDAAESHEPFKLYLLIDALDEAEYEADVRQMIRFLIQLSDRAVAAGGKCQLRTCLSSRHYPHIVIGRGLSLVVEDQPEHSHDIKTYINKQLSCPDGPEKQVLQASILQKSSRIFLWVVLVVDMLNKLDDRGSLLSEMQARLETVPQSLNELFRGILLQGEHGTGTTVLLFQCLIFGLRPLSPADLYVAIEYSRSADDPAWVLPSAVTPPSPERLARYVLDCSHGLVEVVEPTIQRSLVVQFIHETVREFLVKDNGLVSIVPGSVPNLAGVSHEILRIACLRCVSANVIPVSYEGHWDNGGSTETPLSESYGGMCSRLPLLNYAISHLLDHAEHAQSHNISQRAFLETQMDEHGRWVDSHRLWWNALKRTGVSIIEEGVTLLYLAVAGVHSSLVSVLIDLKDVVNNRVPPQGNTALQLTSVRGDSRLVQLLLEAGAKPNVQSGGGSSVYLASREGHLRVVQLLLEAGAEINLRKEAHVCFHHALSVASARGHEGVVKALLEAGARIDDNGPDGTALEAASEDGHERVVRILLKAGADSSVRASGARDTFLTSQRGGPSLRISQSDL